MLYDADTIIHVTCSHPEDSSVSYRFAINSAEYDSDKDLRDAVEERVNRHGYWHTVDIWYHVEILGKTHTVMI